MKDVKIHEVGLRDGLQMEKSIVSTEVKIGWIDQLLGSGVDLIQVGSFVHPEKVPQMKDTDEIFNHYLKNGKGNSSAVLSGLVLNERGMERGLKCGVELFCLGVSASETHSMKNTGMSVNDALRRIIGMAKEISGSGKPVQVSVQSAFGCGFEGRINENKVLDIVKQYLAAGIRRISLADTAGHGDPVQVEKMMGKIRELDTDAELAVHFHNTYGMALANAYVAVQSGAAYVETAFAGLGGCPFTKQPAGNLCTEDYVHALQRFNVRQDVNLGSLIDLAGSVSRQLGRDLPGYVYKSGPINYIKGEKK